ncbi:unnamed protein product [Rotaria magnacalcarata]|nr:unnamed protein product [Rotaria magnacalcarata]
MLEDSHMQEDLFFSDEATFYVGGLVSKHNIRYRSETNPHVTIETVMNSPKLNVWCAMSKNKLLGPYFFEDDTDGAPPHFSIDVRRYLDDHFPRRWIVRGGSIRWAPRSPDLTPLDFFLWGI